MWKENDTRNWEITSSVYEQRGNFEISFIGMYKSSVETGELLLKSEQWKKLG